jgi:hypothetical protein
LLYLILYIYIYLFIFSDKATNPKNHITDTAAVVEICNILNKEPCCVHVATRVIATKIQSLQEWEALQALNVSMLVSLNSQMTTGVPLAKEMITKEQTSNMRVLLSCSIQLT